MSWFSKKPPTVPEPDPYQIDVILLNMDAGIRRTLPIRTNTDAKAFETVLKGLRDTISNCYKFPGTAMVSSGRFRSAMVVAMSRIETPSSTLN